MFDISWSELLVIAIVIIVVVGPKDLPKMLRAFGKTTSKMRVMANDFRRQFDEALKEAELEDLKSLAEDARKLNPANELKRALNPMEKAARDVRAGLDAALKPTPGSSKTEPAAGAVTEAAQPAAATPAAVPKPAKAGNGAATTVVAEPAPPQPDTATRPAASAPKAGTAAKPAAAAKPKAAAAARGTATTGENAK